jgi:aspartate aminotransferase-like enzyme
MMNQTALDVLETTQSSSFACDLKKWLEIMRAYENGAHAYHATMPTDSLVNFSRVMQEAKEYGFDKLCMAQQELGDRIRALLVSKGINSVAAEGFQAPGVVVSYTQDSGFQNGSKFTAEGMQIAAGVPLQCDEPDDFKTFRLGLFGLDKLYDVDAAVERFESILDRLR